MTIFIIIISLICLIGIVIYLKLRKKKKDDRNDNYPLW